jgi:hypothetical protein
MLYSYYEAGVAELNILFRYMCRRLGENMKISWQESGTDNNNNNNNNTNNNESKNKSKALVCQASIPTERPPLVGEVSANFCGYRSVA